MPTSVPPASLVVTGARILTMDPARPRAEAVAVAGERIVAVGSNEAILSLATPETRRIDARGATVLPGFSENHMHLFSGAAELGNLRLDGVHGADAFAAALSAYAAERPGHGPLFADAADYHLMGDRPPTRQEIDRVVADRPVLLVAADHHTAWANTAALAAAGLLHGRALPPGNEVVVGPDGTATGELREMEAFTPVLQATGHDRYRLGLSTGGEPDPRPTPEEFEADLAVMRAGLAHAARHGITTIQNMDGNLYQLELLAELRRRGELTARVTIPFHFKPFMDLAMLDKAERMARDFADDWLRSGLVKLFYDGVLDSRTAVMLDDYPGQPGWRGEPLFEPARFAEIIAEIDRRGLQIAVHAIGEGAVRAVLDACEQAAAANGRRDSRHRIEHVETITAADVPRFARLGVIASMQPQHAPGAGNFPLEPTLSVIGAQRWPLAFAWRTLKAAGARIPFASDWPVSPIDPLAGICAALTRPSWAPGLPDQRFTLEEAIAAYTVEGAYAEFTEDRKGRIRPGFLADLVVLSADIESIDPTDLTSVRPVATVAGGRVTYASA